MPVNHGAKSAAGGHNSDHMTRSSDRRRDRDSDLDRGQVSLQCKGCGELFETESMLRRHRSSGRGTHNARCRAAGPGVPKRHGSDVPVRHGTGGSGRFHISALDPESDDYDEAQDFFQPPSLQVNTD